MLNDPLMLASLGLVLLSLALFYWPESTDEPAQPPAEPEKDDGLFPLALLSAPKASGEHQAAAEAGRANAASESSLGVTNKNRPTSITATKRARFAGFSAIAATRCSACVAMTPAFFQHWRGI